jgi:hypothetical protein
MNWEGLIALVYGLVFFWGSGNALFQRGLGAKRLGPGRITRTSNPVRYWGTVTGFFMASIVCLFWAYTHSRYGAYLGVRSLTSFLPPKLAAILPGHRLH